jgi:hypothetical protein
MPDITGTSPNTASSAVNSGDNITENSEQTEHWRDVLPIHPATELFPLMGEAELRELAVDIEANGLLERVTIIEQDGVPCLLDGRNRLDALELLGREIFVSKYSEYALYKNPKRMTWEKRREAIAADRDCSVPSIEIFESGDTDNPFAFVLSKNVRRRHLTPEQKRPLIVELVKASAERSNALLAEWGDVDDHYISDIREELEATSEIPRFEKTIGKDGKARPARKAATEPKVTVGAVEAKSVTNAHDDIKTIADRHTLPDVSEELTENSEVASPEEIEENILHTLQRSGAVAAATNKIIKVSSLDRGARARVSEAIERLIAKWRSTQATLNADLPLGFGRD